MPAGTLPAKLPATMRAALFHEHGGPEVLRVAEVPVPQPGPGEALVAVAACALNHLDLWVRRGGPAFERLPKPHVGGADVAGTVVALGEGVTGWAPGARVVLDPGLTKAEDEWTRRGEDSVSPGYEILGEERWGGLAEYIAIPARNLVGMPDEYPFEPAAAAPLVYLTAWRMLVHRAALGTGETVAIVGAGGGVNSAAIQIARLVGATVFAITSTPEKMEKARALGADHVVNYRAEDWSKAVFHLTAKRGVDVVVDNVGKATLMASVRALARGGRLVVVGNTSGPLAELDLRYLFRKQISLIGSTMGSHQDFERVMGLVFGGQLRPVVDRVLPLEQIGEAHAVLERGEQFGKVVLVP
jgi:NADPH:quinone reductase-like Zn-dependent oxidoreductase